MAAFLGGSHGRGVADAFSDVDLCVIAKDDAYEALVCDRIGFVGRLGNPLFLEDFGFTGLVFFVIDDGIEGELFFGSEGRLEELEAGPTFRTLFDPGGILGGSRLRRGTDGSSGAAGGAPADPLRGSGTNSRTSSPRSAGVSSGGPPGNSSRSAVTA